MVVRVDGGEGGVLVDILADILPADGQMRCVGVWGQSWWRCWSLVGGVRKVVGGSAVAPGGDVVPVGGGLEAAGADLDVGGADLHLDLQRRGAAL